MALRRQAFGLLSQLSRACVPLEAASCGIRHYADHAGDQALKKTPLYDYHVSQGGKMVPFAGYSMPIQYSDSIIDSSNWCRSKASIFDVSHMCGLTLKGKDAISFLEGLVVSDVAGLKDGTGSLSVMTNERGGIIDDTVITKVSPTEIYMVLNAGCREKDLAHINKHLAACKGDVQMTVHDDRCLLALQGPLAASVLQELVAVDLSKVYFSNFVQGLEIAGVKDCFLTRTGRASGHSMLALLSLQCKWHIRNHPQGDLRRRYTGEDGFELSVPDAGVLAVTEKLMSNENVRMAGLGPRDSLRLEAGLCLYGNDLNEDITPVEASLTWTVGARRKEKYDFVGGDVIKQQIMDGVKRRRVGILSTGAPARAGAELLTPSGEKVGEMTSGAFSPNLKKNVGMGYVNKPYDKAGTALKVVVRGKENDATVSKMPFIPVTYYRPPK